MDQTMRAILQMLGYLPPMPQGGVSSHPKGFQFPPDTRYLSDQISRDMGKTMQTRTPGYRGLRGA